MGFIRQSFKRQIFVVFLAVTLVLVIFGGILTLQGFQARIRADYEQGNIDQDIIVMSQLESDFKLAETALDRIMHNKVLVDCIGGTRNNNLLVYTELYDSTREIRDFAVVELYAGSNCVYSTQSGYSAKSLPQGFSVLRDAKDNPGETVYALDPGNTTQTGSALLIARLISDGDTPGYAVIRVEQDEIKEKLKNKINAKDGFMLTNKYLRPYCLMGIAENGITLNIIRKNLMAGNLYNAGIKGNVYMSEIGDSGLLGIYVTPPALEDSAIHVGYQIILIQAVISVIICLLVASRMSSYFSKPISLLAAAMKRYRKGDFDTRIELDREDEFEQLAVGFNKMTTQLNKTMEERVQAEHKVNETRIQMMQAQLNPHFLYNTLDTIKWVAKANQVPEVATMSASLAGILRTSISERQFCPLSKELELVQNYCDIQKIRFDDAFELEIDVPAELQNAVIPKLILQPMVENAIIHGMEEVNNGHIYIAAIKDTRNDKDLLKISIQDDGKGISDEMMQALNNDDVETLKGHLGLNNVNTIIRLYYGKEYGVMAFRPSQGGTVMIVTLPYSEKEPKME